MVNSIKLSTFYGLFILESDGVTNDDWVTDHGHPKEAIWDWYAEGVDYIFLPYVTSMKRNPEFSFDIIDFFMGEGADISLGEGHDLVIFEGRFGGANETERNAKMANLLLLYAKHLKASNEVLYLGYRKKGEIWEPFFDTTPATVYYLKGKLIHASYERAEDELFYNWKVVFRGVQ